MTPERWQRLQALFHEASELPPADAETRLREECGGDEDLYAGVRRMLDAAAATTLLDESPWRIPLPSESSSFIAGQTVAGRYRILRHVASGGMGEVFEAEDAELGQRVALKTLLPDNADDNRMVERFKQELALARRVSHPNVCRVFDLARHSTGGSPDILFLSMEFLPGETLAARLEREGKMLPAQALPLVAQMAAGLDAAHSAGVIHRDLKPSNVMLVEEGGQMRAIITDFGLARSYAADGGQSTWNVTGKVMGTLDYMAPELLTGSQASEASDIYALGMVVFRMVTGALPFSDDTPLAGAIRRSKEAPPSPRLSTPGLKVRWERALRRAMDPNPVRRFATAGEFAATLRGETTALPLQLLPVSRRHVGVVLLALVAVLVLAFLGSRWWRPAMPAPSMEALNLYRKGVEDLQAGAYFAATQALSECLRLSPRYIPARARLAEGWMELDMPDRASQEMLVARRQDVSSLPQAERLRLEAVDLSITHEYGAAAAKYAELAKLQPGGDPDLDLGRAYENAGDPVRAQECFRRAAEGESHNPAAWLHLAIYYSRASDNARADQAFEESARLYRLTSNLEGLTEVAFQRGVAADRQSQFEDAAVFLNQALGNARLANDAPQAIHAELQLATNAFLAGDGAAAQRYASEALDVAQRNQVEGLAAMGLHNLGNAHLRKLDNAGAEKYYQDALMLARRGRNPRMLAVSQLALASLYDQWSRPEDASRQASAALPYFESLHAREAFSCLTILGRGEAHRGNWTAALDAAGRQLQLATASRDPSRIAFAEDATGQALMGLERFPEALDHFQRVMAAGASEELAGYGAEHCAEACWRIGRFDDARAYLDKARPATARYLALRLDAVVCEAELLLCQRRFVEAMTLAGSSLPAAVPRPVVAAQLNLVMALAEVRNGRAAEGLALCRKVAGGLVGQYSPETEMRAQLALAEARIETGDRQGGLDLLRSLDSALATAPESRFRARALAARADRAWSARASEAARDLMGRWGDGPFRSYWDRPDIIALVRPLSLGISAK